jgi:SAM-dependent methyltransferase
MPHCQRIETQEVEPLNPFLTLGICDDEEEEATFFSSLGSDGEFVQRCSGKRKSKGRRSWGIPDFDAQCNGQRSFEILINEQSVLLELEHRLRSTGSDLWDSALVLSHALNRLSLIEGYDSCDLADKTVLELGSGTGAVGLVCAKCLHSGRVVATDLEANLGLIERNIKSNGLGTSVSCLALDWKDELKSSRIMSITNNKKLDVIVGSDLFLPFAKDLLQPLARTLSDLLRPSCSSTCAVAWICFEERFDASDFFCFASGYGLVVSEICNHVLHPVYQDSQIHLLRISTSRSQQL